jgi:hypothetical protein
LSSEPTSGFAGEYLEMAVTILAHTTSDHTYQGWSRTQKNAQNCAALVMMIWPMILARTFLDTRLAVGLFECIMA